MTRLEPKHCPVWGQMNRKTPIPVPQVFTVSDCRRNRSLAHWWDLLRDFVFVFPCAACWISAKYSVWPEFDLCHRPHRIRHAAIVGRTKWFEQRFPIALQTYRERNHRIALQQIHAE